MNSPAWHFLLLSRRFEETNKRKRMIPIDLSDRTALITGASQGLGRATAKLLHQAGANVVINYFDDRGGQNRSLAEEVVAELGDRACALPADVRNREQVDQMLEEILRCHPTLNIVVNNAGIIRDRSLLKMTQQDWQEVIDTNLTGVFQVSQAAASRIVDGGRIVNMASISGVLGIFGQCNYSAAKAGVIGLTKALSKELARKKVTVNAVSPGVVLTDMGLSIPEEYREQMLAQVPLRRFAEPEEIAQAILFLCSDLASYITGQTLHVNGGWFG
jgi:3-oxoacyl-[acyl-carrier protein] reductase